jgi:hypothetical protein
VKSSADEVARYVSAVVKAVRRQRYKGIKALRNSTLIHLYYHHHPNIHALWALVRSAHCCTAAAAALRCC